MKMIEKLRVCVCVTIIHVHLECEPGGRDAIVCSNRADHSGRARQLIFHSRFRLLCLRVPSFVVLLIEQHTSSVRHLMCVCNRDADRRINRVKYKAAITI